MTGPHLDAELFATIPQAYGVELIGPTGLDVKTQARARQGFAAADFTIDWERRQAVCPAGRTSSSWTPAVDNRKNDVIKIKFSGADCAACPSRAQCIDPRAKREVPRRSFTVRPEAQYHALRDRPAALAPVPPRLRADGAGEGRAGRV